MLSTAIVKFVISIGSGSFILIKVKLPLVKLSSVFVKPLDSEVWVTLLSNTFNL